VGNVGWENVMNVMECGNVMPTVVVALSEHAIVLAISLGITNPRQCASGLQIRKSWAM